MLKHLTTAQLTGIMQRGLLLHMLGMLCIMQQLVGAGVVGLHVEGMILKLLLLQEQMQL